MKVNAARPKIVSIVITTLISGLLVSIPVPSNAAPLSSPNCTLSVGLGGSPGVSTNQAGHGCVIIKYNNGSADVYETFNYTGADQSWTSPASTTALTFYLVGAGGGAMNAAGRGPGASGGFATGSYSAASSTVFKIIVGQGGNGTEHTLNTYGGGGKADYGSGGGRSAIRVGNETEDLITAGGAGGGGYDAKCGGAGGGSTGQDAVVRTANGEHGKGGTQTAGGAGGYSVNGKTGGTGTKYQGGLGQDDSGGGGGGYWGGGGGGDNIGAGGGSGYLHPSLITSGQLVQGTCTTVGNSSALSFAISYDGNGKTGGSVPANTTVNAFASTSLATNSGTLARTNYTFSGWNTAADGGGTSYAAGATGVYVNKDTTLYAQWNSTITYNANGSTGTAPAAVVTTGSATSTFNLNSGSGLTKTNLTFTGWNTAADGSGTNYAGGSSYASTGSVTFYAIFKPTISYNANGANTGTVPVSVVAPAPGTTCIASTGYTNCKIFSYTGADQTFTIPSDIDTSKGILVEVWGAGGGGSVAYYNDPSGGAGGFSKATLTTPTIGEALKIVVGEGGLVRDQTVQYGGGGIGGLGGQVGSSGGGYSGIFSGTTPLVISGGGGGTSPGSASNGTPGGGGGANQNGGEAGTAAVAGRGGTSSAGGAGATGNASCPTTGSASPNGSSLLGGASCDKASSEGGGGGGGGYFGGGGGTYQASGGGPENGGGGGGSGYLDLTRGTSLTATAGANGVIGNFAYPDRTSVNYSNNAGRSGKAYTNTTADNSGGDGLITIQWKSSTPDLTIADNTGNLVRTGYTFLGWNTAANGTGTRYNVLTSATPSTNLVLYAEWSANNYAVTFDANGGSGTMSNLAIVAGTAKALTANAFTRTGYTFAGWTTAANGTGTAYTNSQSVTLYADVTLYAKWTANSYTITFNANGGTGTMATSAIVAGTAKIITANAYTRSNHLFAGWSTVTGVQTVVYTDQQSITLYANTTLYAQWTPVYAITYNANTGTGTVPSGATVIAGNSYTLASNTGNLVKGSIAFAGWNTKADGTGATYLAATSFTPTATTTLYAMYLSACTPTSTTANGYVVLTFTGAGNCLWGTPAGVTSIDLLAVGGGGGGGSSLGGGGGGGQVVSQTGVASIGTAVISVAAGGSGGIGGYTAAQNHGKTGGRSGYVTPTVSTTALGGSGGNGRMSATNLNSDGTAISTGWTGGGGAYANTPAEVAIAGVGGVNYIGGTGSGNGGAGGGGAGGVGVNSASGSTSAGGAGVSNSINGTSTIYGGGGGGGKYSGNASWTGTGGTGGGGNGSTGTNVALNGNGNGSNGETNKGGGGGGGYEGGTGGTGGTGIVILRYAYGTPSAPIITSITGSANKLIVAFTAPTSDGGAAITNYEYSLNGGVTWTALSPVDATSPIEITKLANGSTTLTNGTTYQVAVRALNGKTGLTSNVVAGTTPLSPPTISAVAANSSATITVGAAAGESPTSFTVTALDNSGVALSPGKTCTVTSPATTCVITGLTNGTTYKFSAVANLGSQVSTATAIATGVTPAAPIVTYDANSGTVGPSSTSTVTAAFNAGTPVVHPLPVRAGYNFTGWFNSSNTLIGQNGSNYEPAATITLTAGWAGVTYSISYNGNGNTGGAVPATGSFVNGSGTPYAILANTGSLTKTGYTFDSWMDGAGTTKSGNYSTGADLQLFAKWTAVQFTVTYDTASGGAAPANQTYTYGTTGLTIDSGSSLSKVGYTFLGWSKTATGTTVSSPFIPTENTTLYARWSGSTFSVAFISNGGSISPATASFTTGGASITLPSPGTQTGYNFAGWSETLNGNIVSDPYTTIANKTLFAKWTAIQYNINFNRGVIGSTTLTAGQPVVFPSNTTSTISTVVTLDSTIDTSTVLSGTTYVFTGWKESGTNSVYKGGDSYRMLAADVTFTAQWVAIYTVSYILNGGTGAVPADVTRTDGTVEPLTTVIPTRAGYTFSKWVDQKGLDVTTSFTVNADRYLLYAVWTPNVYTITYVPGASVTGTATATTGGYKESVTLSSDSTLSYANYKFVGWKIGTIVFSAGGSYVLSANVNAEAQWESTLSQIFYDINGGTGSAAPSVATQNQAVTLPLVGTFTRSGYSLAGWIGGGVTTPAATYTNTTTNSVTLIAQWTLLAPAISLAPTAVAGSGSATITVNPSSGGGPADSYVVTALDSSGNPLNPSKSCTVYSPSTSCTISGLTDGTSYKFSSTATNSAGTSSSSVASTAVTPAGKPSIVTGASATASNASAVVRFTAPATNGGAPIVSYTVTASTGQTCVITPTFPDPLGCTVNGLTNGTAVTFAVQANNGAYTSDSSTATIAVTPATVPGAPTRVTGTSSEPGKVTITFTAPASNGGSATTEYVITSSPGGLTCIATVPSTGCEITGLTNGTAYTFTAIARNLVGNSANSTASAAVTPVGKPSTPTNIVVSAGNASATISFTAPNTGGSAITRYDVEAYDENGVPISPALTCTLNVPFPTPLACTFANTLSNGLKYSFKVSATNVIGTSDSSTATAVITPANLIAPTADQILTPTGETTIGSVITSSVQFGGFPTPTVTYIWERCTTSAATSCTTIAGATADTYTTTSADDGFFIRYKATGTNAGGNAVGTSLPTAKITDNPVVTTPTSGLSGTPGTAFTLNIAATGGAEPFTFAVSAGTLPAGLSIDATTGTISGTPTAAATAVITVLVADTKGKTASTTFTITITGATSNVTPEPEPTPVTKPEPVCEAACQAANVKAAADAAAKAAVDKATSEAATKVKADAAATAASNKATADVAAAVAAAKAAVDKAAAAALAQAAADAAAKTAVAQAKVASDAQAAAAKAAAAAQATLKNSTTTAAAKAAATKSANTAATAAATAVKAAATAAQQAAQAKTTAANATKQVDIAINSLNSKTAASQASAQANAIAAAAKAAANEAAAAAATKAAEAKARATTAQKAASDTAARIATEQKQAADAAALAKIATEAAAKATAVEIAATEAARVANEALVKILNEKAALAEQAVKATTETARAEINKKIEEVTVKAEEAQKVAETAATKADAAEAAQEEAVETAEDATEEAQIQAAEAVEVKAESVTKTAEATKAVAAATVAAKVATAAKAAAAKVPATAKIVPKPSTSTSKNSAKATVTGLKPGQKVKVTVNVKGK